MLQGELLERGANVEELRKTILVNPEKQEHILHVPGHGKLDPRVDMGNIVVLVDIEEKMHHLGSCVESQGLVDASSVEGRRGLEGEGWCVTPYMPPSF